MPSKSPEQAKTMQAVAHGWRPTGSAAGIPVKVAKEFVKADTGKGAKRPPPKPASKKRGR